MNKIKSNRILIIHAEGNVFNIPSLKCIVDMLSAAGFELDIRYCESHASMPARKYIRYLPYSAFVHRVKSNIANKLCSKLLITASVFIEYILYYRKYDLIIAVDRQGLLEASVLNKLTKTPYIYISFEILFESETSSRFKVLEKEASNNVTCWIVQDNVRAQKLEEENHLKEDAKFILPLASSGLGKSSSDRLRDSLGIDKTKKVAILIGSVIGWAMTSEIIKSVTNWPDDWVLIVHERYGRTRDILANELNSISSLIGKKIFLSDSATENVDDMAMILSGIDAGLAFYKPDYTGIYTGKNLKYLGMASGKISTYFRYGVPVIVNEIGLYADVIRQHNLGVVVSSPNNISNQLDEFNNKRYSDNAAKYFSKYLDFNNYSSSLLETMMSSMSNK